MFALHVLELYEFWALAVVADGVVRGIAVEGKVIAEGADGVAQGRLAVDLAVFGRRRAACPRTRRGPHAGAPLVS